MNTNKPTFKVVVGGVNAAVWANEIQMPNGTSRTIEKATIERRYRNGDGEYKSTNSYDANDIPRLILALSRVYEHMVLKAKDSNGGARDEDGLP